MRVNPVRSAYLAARAAAAVDAQSPAESAAAGAESGAVTVAGVYDATTGRLKPAGITGVTRTSEPFYSARG